MKWNPTLVKIVRSIFAYWKIKSFRHYLTAYVEEWFETCCDDGLLIAKSFTFRKKELDQQSLNCVARNKCLLKMHDSDTLIEQSL